MRKKENALKIFLKMQIIFKELYYCICNLSSLISYILNEYTKDIYLSECVWQKYASTNSVESMCSYERIMHDPISTGSNSKQTQRFILSIPAIH